MTEKHENGVALLFALGLLSLMSVLGVAFVANTLTAQKIAVNLSSRNQSQILLDSAVNRIMISIMALLRLDNSTTDFSSIYSTNDGAARTKNITAPETLHTHDQLSDANTSKLNMLIPGLAKYDGSKSKATWLYIRGNDGKILGRMAFQILPTGLSSMSLDRVLKGVYNPLTKALIEGVDKSSTSWQQRIGKEINELYIGQVAAFRQPWAVENDPDKTLPANSNETIVSSFDEFFSSNTYKIIGDPADTITDPKRKIWLRRWFSESVAAAPEVFYYAANTTTRMEEATPYHRFNVGPIENVTTEKWYRRIKGFVKSDGTFDEEIKNGKKAVEAILANSLRFYPEDVYTPQGSGISYLRKIAKDAGSFDSLEARRQQIAANLNDYCDEDSIPTSDVPAKDWDASSSAKTPQYTGNEKTPYINEFVLSLQVHPELSSSTVTVAREGTTSLSSSGNVNVSFKAVPRIIGEVVNIYNTLSGDYKFKVWFSGLSYKLSVSADAEVRCTMSDATTKTLSLTGITAADVTFSQSGISHGSETVRASSFVNGYQAVEIEKPDVLPPKDTFDPISGNVDLKDIISDRLAKSTDVNLKDVTAFTVALTNVRIKIADVKFNLQGAGLFDSSGNGVDFVRGPGDADTEKIVAVGEANYSLTPTAGTTLWPAGVDAADRSLGWNFLYVSGMEVRDPRQNLNFNDPNTVGKNFKTARSDWKCEPVLEFNINQNASGDDRGTMNIKHSSVINNATKPYRIKCEYLGKVNTCSNPKEPFTGSDFFKTDPSTGTSSAGISGEDYDKENVTDPAWLGTDASQHLSTAYIRNAPMQSLWEIGAIHRASAWETINIKGATVTASGTTRRIEMTDNNLPANLTTEGTDYIDGDGILLDQVKLTGKAYSSGKLDVNMLHEVIPATPVPGYTVAWNNDMARALLANVRYGQQISVLETLPTTHVAATGTAITWADTAPLVTYLQTKPAGRTGKNANKYISRADFFQGHTSPQNTATRFLANGYGLVPNYTDLSDAQQEELVGKTANLLTAGATAPTTIHAVVIVQTIRPVNTTGTIIKPVLDKNGNLISPAPSFNKTDNTFAVKTYNNEYVYFDEITGELRALVTIKILNDPKRLQLHSIKYY